MKLMLIISLAAVRRQRDVSVTFRRMKCIALTILFFSAISADVRIYESGIIGGAGESEDNPPTKVKTFPIRERSSNVSLTG